MLICTLGDLLLDVIVRPGPAARARTPTPSAVTHVGPGGQAANVAAWAVALGAEARFVGKRGDDAAGALVGRGARAARGVEWCGPVVAGRTGVVVSLVAPDGDRTMASDRGVAPGAARGRARPARGSPAATCLHLSGYSLMRSPIDGAALAAAGLRAGCRRARERGPLRVAGDPRVRRRAAPREARASWRPTSSSRTSPRSGSSAGRVPGRRWVLKRGPRGARFDGARAAGAAGRRSVDATGAGDALAAGYLVGGPELAIAAAARCCRARSERCHDRGALRSPTRSPRRSPSDARSSRSRRRSSRTASPRRRRRRGRARERAPGARGGRGARDDRRARRRAARRPLGGRARALRRRTRARSARATSPPASCRARSARRRSAARSRSAARPGSGFMGTGGLGGVHRGFPSPPDVSADLARARAHAGARRLLRRQVAARRGRDRRAAGDARRARARLPHRHAAALLLRPRRPAGLRPRRVGRGSGPGRPRTLGARRRRASLVGRPPDESLDDVEPLIEEALAEARRRGVTGQAVTPFVLASLHQASGGRHAAASTAT